MINVSQKAKPNLSLNKIAEIMEKIQAVPNLGKSYVTKFV